MINESLLQFIWQFQYFNPSQLTTCEGEVLQVIHTGKHNTHQGPDFENAKIKIGNTLWVGSVELHLKTSDWQKHRHQLDKNYKNVVLHVVYENDLPAFHTPVLELKNRIATCLLHRYEMLMKAQQFIPCADLLHTVPHLTLHSWLERLVASRLVRKSQLVQQYLTANNGHWEESFWWLLARNFGMKVNASLFEAVAQSIPLTILAKHKSNLVQLEALLLGQAGLLAEDFTDTYVLLLKKEYQFLQKKYTLQPVHQPVHFLRMRPGNFPTLRLAQLAALVQHSAHLFSKVVAASCVKEIMQWFSVTANDFWYYHYQLQEASAYKKKRVGKTTIENIIINTIVPVVFAYGQYNGKQALKDKALQWLSELPPEKNRITKGFEKLQVRHTSAWDSQALIELQTQYCDARRCLECAIGNSILKKI